MAQWACTIGRLDIAFAVSSLSRFSASPRTHHLELALHLFGYLKKNPNRRIVLDSRPMLVGQELLLDSFHPDFLEDYPDAKEDLDDTLPQAYGDELSTSVFLNPITLMITLLDIPFLASLSLSEAPRLFGKVNVKDVSQPAHTVLSSLRCVPLWKMQSLYGICSDALVCLSQSLRICSAIILESSKVLRYRKANSRRNTLLFHIITFGKPLLRRSSTHIGADHTRTSRIYAQRLWGRTFSPTWSKISWHDRVWV
jgi:hypothetical protein